MCAKFCQNFAPACTLLLVLLVSGSQRCMSSQQAVSHLKKASMFQNIYAQKKKIQGDVHDSNFYKFSETLYCVELVFPSLAS